MTSDQADSFESEARALYEKHKAIGFFTYMTEDDGRVEGVLRAAPADRMGVLIGSLDIGGSIMKRLRRAPDRESA